MTVVYVQALRFYEPNDVLANFGSFSVFPGNRSYFPENGSKVQNFGLDVKFVTKTQISVQNFGLKVKFGSKTSNFGFVVKFRFGSEIWNQTPNFGFEFRYEQQTDFVDLRKIISFDP